MSIEVALQVAIHAKLTNDLTADVFHEGDVPDNYSGVYVVVGNDTHIEWDTDGETGFESTVTIHTWDTSGATRGYGTIKPVMGECYQSLHRATIGITGFHLVGIDREMADTFIDADGLTPHGVERYRVITRKL